MGSDHTYHHKVKYYECDRMGITHHSNYVRFMEEARIDHLEQLGYGFDRLEAEGVTSPVVSISCNYRKPTTFNDVVEIRTVIKEIKAARLTIEYTMTVGADMVFTGESVHCFIENGRPVRIEERFPLLH